MDHVETCRAIWAQKKIVDEISIHLEAEKSKLEVLKKKVIVELDSQELTKVHIPGSGTIYIQTKFSIETPKTPDSKLALFGYIEKEKGPEVLLGMQSIHSATLNSFYEQESTVAAERGDHRWALPGVGEPKMYKTLGTRKG